MTTKKGIVRTAPETVEAAKHLKILGSTKKAICILKENPQIYRSHASLPEEDLDQMPEPLDVVKIKVTSVRPLAKSKSMRHETRTMGTVGGSKIFENYTAKIKERTNLSSTGHQLQVPKNAGAVTKRGSLSDLNEDPDLGDSSRFTRRSKIRSTWSAGRNTPAHNTVADDANKKELKLFQKIGKLFTGK